MEYGTLIIIWVLPLQFFSLSPVKKFCCDNSVILYTWLWRKKKSVHLFIFFHARQMYPSILYLCTVAVIWIIWCFLLLQTQALQFVQQLGDALHSISSEKNPGQPLQLVYVIGPPSSEKLQEHDFGPRDLETLSGAVDGFSLMTYDFSNPHNPGPNAPLKWIQIILQLLLGTSGSRGQSVAPKILLGINFYGNDFSLLKGNSFLCFLPFFHNGIICIEVGTKPCLRPWRDYTAH